MKAPKNDDSEKLGVTFILLASEVVQNIGKWYPKDYFEGDAPSRFAKAYHKLLKEGVKFPEYGSDLVMKPDDKGTFEKNFAIWKKRVEEAEKDMRPA